MKIMRALFLLEKANLEDDDFDDDASVSIGGRWFVSFIMSTVRRANFINLYNKQWQIKE